MERRLEVAAAAPAAGAWLEELRATIALAAPLALAQLGQIAIGTTDVLMVGRLGERALAGVALGNGLYYTVFLFGLGVLTTVAALAAQARGARAPRDVRRVVRQGLWVGTTIGLPSLAVLWHAEELLLLFGQDGVAARDAGSYVDVLMWGILPSLWFVALRGFVSALGRPRPILWTVLAGIVLNALLDYALIFGKLGAPELGIVGAGIASTAVNTGMCLALLAIAVFGRPFRRYLILRHLWRSDWSRFREIFRIGLPVGVAILLEVGLFTTALYLMGLLGTAQVAAHQIAIQVAATTFMVTVGISQAATVRVGLAFGRRDPEGVRRAGWTAMALGAAFMSVMALVFWFLPRPIVGLFVDLTAPENAAVVRLAVALIMVAALFQLADGAQAIAAGVLRGMSDTRVPMVIAGIGYWGVGLTSCVLLGFVLGLGGVGIWIGLAIGLAAVGGALVHRFHVRDLRRTGVGGTPR
ncbi:MAG: MATE family efflux transporter [Alphaproteobacteria bacterium]